MGSARPKSRKYTYIAYERGGSELPIAVTETVEEMAELLKVSARTIFSLCQGKEEQRVRLPFTLMRVLDEEDD